MKEIRDQKVKNEFNNFFQNFDHKNYVRDDLISS
jgi:hypothetical protein